MGVGTLRRVVPRVRAIGSGGRSGRGRRSPRTEAHHTSGGPFPRPPHVRIGRRGTAISQTVRATPHDHRRRLRREATRPRKDATQSGLNMPDRLRDLKPSFSSFTLPSAGGAPLPAQWPMSGIVTFPRPIVDSRRMPGSSRASGSLLPHSLCSSAQQCSSSTCSPTSDIAAWSRRDAACGPGSSHRLAVISQRLPARPGLSAAASAGTRSNAGMA